MLYNDNVDDIDAYIGGLAEDHLPNSNLGELFWISTMEQFENLRNGDRFWYENPEQFTPEEIAEIYGTTLAAIVKRNLNVKNLPENVFFIRERQLNGTGKISSSMITSNLPFVDYSFLYSGGDEYDNYIDLSTNYRLSWFVEADEIQFMMQVVSTGWYGSFLQGFF